MKYRYLIIFYLILNNFTIAQNFEQKWGLQLISNNINNSKGSFDKQNNYIFASVNIHQVNLYFNPIDSFKFINNYGMTLSSINSTGINSWTKLFAISSYNLSLQDICTDSNNNIYILGTFITTLFYGNNFQDSLRCSQHGKSPNGFVAKLSSTGTILWVKQIVVNKDINYLKIRINAQNQPILFGNYKGTIDFDLGPQSQLNYGSNTKDKSFINQYDENMNLIWYKTFGQNDSDCEFYDFELDQNNDIVIVGYLNGTVDLDPSTSINNLTLNENGMFVLKLTSSGDYLWHKHFKDNNTYKSWCENLTISDNNAILLNFYLDDVYNIETDSSKLTEVTSNGNYDILIVALNTNGETIWHYQIGGLYKDEPNKIVSNDKGIFISGDFVGNIDFDASPSSAFYLNSEDKTTSFLLHLDNDGKFETAHKFQSNIYTKSFDLDVNEKYIMLCGAFKDSLLLRNQLLVNNRLDIPKSGFIINFAFQQNNTSLINNDNKIMYNVYPNPVSTILNVNGFNSNADYTILNSLGQEVLTGVLIENYIDVSQLSNGIYTLKLNNTNSKIIVQK